MNEMTVSNANNTLSNSLAEALGMDLPQIQALTPMIEVKPPVARPNANTDHITGDAEYARQNIYDVIEKGNEALFHAMELAKEAAHPRMYEVLGQLLKTQAENVDKLLKIQSDLKKLNDNTSIITPAQQSLNVTNSNVVFYGTADELVRMVRGEQKIIKTIEKDTNL